MNNFFYRLSLFFLTTTASVCSMNSMADSNVIVMQRTVVFSDLKAGMYQSRWLVLKNIGDRPATINNIIFERNSPSNPDELFILKDAYWAGSCMGKVLAAFTGECNNGIYYKPLTAFDASQGAIGTVRYEYTNGSGTLGSNFINIRNFANLTFGTGTQNVIVSNPAAMDFRGVPLGSTVTRTLYIKNVSLVTVTHLQVGVPLPEADYTRVSTTCGTSTSNSTSLAPNATCQVTVRFTARSTSARIMGFSHYHDQALGSAYFSGN